ncbi:hypothetical protein ACKZDW_21985 [Ralstonia syzygii subsp. celebesensis]|uniref:hypothetical protein n=1 Tax=Ralstonia syzygii TaxID=28097 RepID=UPI00387E1F5B
MDMPMKKKRTLASQAAARGPLPELPKELLDELVKGPMTAGEVQGLSEILCARHIMRSRSHGYADEEETHVGVAGSGARAVA